MSRIVYVEEINACCPFDWEKGQKLPHKSQEQLIADRDVFARIYVVDNEDLTEVWGDDWNDAPSCSNSGAPYGRVLPGEKGAKNMRVIELRYGDEWPNTPVQHSAKGEK